MGRVKVPYLAVVLPLVLQHLLEVQAAGQVAFSQVVAELRNAEQTLLHTHCFTACKQEYTHKQRKRATKINENMYLTCFRLYLNDCREVQSDSVFM